MTKQIIPPTINPNDSINVHSVLSQVCNELHQVPGNNQNDSSVTSNHHRFIQMVSSLGKQKITPLTQERFIYILDEVLEIAKDGMSDIQNNTEDDTITK